MEPPAKPPRMFTSNRFSDSVMINRDKNNNNNNNKNKRNSMIGCVSPPQTLYSPCVSSSGTMSSIASSSSQKHSSSTEFTTSLSSAASPKEEDDIDQREDLQNRLDNENRPQFESSTDFFEYGRAFSEEFKFCRRSPPKKTNDNFINNLNEHSRAVSTTTNALLSSLDKSILQIRDWLTLLEDMLRKDKVDISSGAHAERILRRQENVLRELEQKKPQLDDLVKTAENLRDTPIKQQIPTKVTQLREHWEDTSTKVTSRKHELEDLIVDSEQYENRKKEIDAWLNRMESWKTRMKPVGEAGERLDNLVKEQKSFHTEIHQFRSNIESFNHLTQELISSYQHDDASKIKKIAQVFNQRYESLNSVAVARGKELNYGLSSQQSFQAKVNSFFTWCTLMESKLNYVESEVDKNGNAIEKTQLSPEINKKFQVSAYLKMSSVNNISQD